MENAKKTFIAGINTDDSFFTLKGEDNVDALNIRVVSSSEGKSGSLSDVDGTREIPNPFPFRNVKVIGSYEDPTSNDIFYFVNSSDFNYGWIFCYQQKTDTIYRVLIDGNLDPDYQFNFQDDKPITGISYIDGILYWTGIDGREPWRINVERGIKTNHADYVTTESAYVTPIPKSVVTLIRKPPMIPLKITVLEDSSRDTSFLKSRAHTFAYRYIYKDGETSVFSPTSNHYPNQDVDNTFHKTSKKIKVDFPSLEAESYGVSQDVDKIQFAVKFDSDTSYYIWKEFDCVTNYAEFAAQTYNTEGAITADFYNDVLGFAVDDASSIKLYDTVPYEAEALSIARNRLFLGNIKEGRLNKAKVNSSDIDLTLIRQAASVGSYTQYDRDRGGKVGFAHSSAYQIGIAFYDFAGRTGGVLTDDSLRIITPEREEQLYNYNSTIRFTLNDSLKNKIPDWAEYYSIVRTKNLTKDFTISNLADKIRYYKTDSLGGFTVNVEKLYPENDENRRKGIEGTPNGTFEDAELVSFSAKYEGVAIGLGDLTSYKQGYTFQEGDRIKLITPTGVFESAIVGQEGRYVKINLFDFNSADYLNTSALSNLDYSVIYEIYSPHQKQPNEFYYEAFNGRIIRSGSEGDAEVSFSDTTGNLTGDVYVKTLKADTSTLDNFFFEGNSKTDGGDKEIDGEIKYIDFPVFYGAGVNDMTCNTGVNNGTGNDDLRFDIKISSTSGSVDKFRWRKRFRNQVGIETAYSTEINITGNSQTLSDGVTVTFGSTTGHTLDDRWVVNYKIADNSAMNQEHEKAYGIFPGGTNGTILVGSEITLYFTEYKGGTFLNSEDRRTWEMTYPGSSVTKTYESIEELFWETSFGTQVITAAGSNAANRFAFRRGTLDPNGNSGQTQLNVLDFETNPTSQGVSTTDGTTIHMIYEGRLEKRSGGRNIDSTNSIAIDFTDEFGYAAESMNPSNDYFLNWTQITGRPNLVPQGVSSQIKNTAIVFSETKIPGSKINGLSKFSALDEKRLDDATGPLRALNLTSKTQSTGTVMLGISENETTSIYLGEQQLSQTSSGGQFLAVSSGVIGTMNTLQGSFGTQHPESIAINEGSAYWFDVKNQTVVKYDSNGLTAIGDVKMKTYFKEKSSIIYSESERRFVIGTYDDYNSEYIISLPQTGESTVTLQQDPYYPSSPVIEMTNAGTTPVTKTVNVVITSPWSIAESVTFIDGVGELEFTSPYAFTIPSNVVINPAGTNMTVVNSTFTSSNGAFQPGTGKLTISNFFSGDYISLRLTRVTLPRTSAVVVKNDLSYSGDTSLTFGPVSSGNTPLRITGATTSLTQEEISIVPSSGSISIPCTSLVPWQFGRTNENYNGTQSGVVTVKGTGNVTNVPANSIGTTGFTPVQDGVPPNIDGFLQGSGTIQINNIDEDVDSVVITTRPLKRPVVTTEAVSGITQTQMVINGTTTNNEATPTSRGFVYSTTNTNPEIGGSGVTQQTVGGTPTDGSFLYTVTGLSASTTLYIKAFYVSNFGTIYGSCITASTGASGVVAPTVTTGLYNAATNAFSGTIDSNGGSSSGTNGITERGFVYSTSDTTPTIGESNVVKLAEQQDDIPSFPYNYTRTGVILINSTQYYFRAYAINDAGTSYGSTVSFTTSTPSPGISGFTLQSSSVNAYGGQVNIDVSKSNISGAASGSVTFKILSGNQIVDSQLNVSVSFTSSQTTDSIQVSVPANYGYSSRSISFQVTGFTNITNSTGQTVPILIGGTVIQGSAGTP